MKALKEFKALVEEMEIKNERFKSDEMFLRYLRARNCDVKKSFEMFQNSVKWREENDVDNSEANFLKSKNSEQILNYWPGIVAGNDHEGIPVYFEAIGRIDRVRKRHFRVFFEKLFAEILFAKSAIDCIPSQDYVLFHLYQMERASER